MYINWDVTIRFDPNSLVPSEQHGIPVPSYGNYGGPNYSAGVEGGTTPEPQDLTTATMPKDALDWLFYEHDRVYQHVKDGLVLQQDVLGTIALADAHLVEDMFALTQTNLKPEAFLYDAFATLGIAGKILSSFGTTFDETTYLQQHNPSDLGQVLAAAQAAEQNFDTGLAETHGAEARSLNGAFHVFEAHFADLVPQV